MVLRLLSLRQCKKILCYVIHGILVHCIVDKPNMIWSPAVERILNSLSMGY